MGQMLYGRYFILEEDINDLFMWASAKLSGQFRMKGYGECPVQKKMIIASLFESAGDLKSFEENYLKRQCNDSVIYTTRRNPSFVCDIGEDRREKVEQRQISTLNGKDRRLH